MTDLDMRDMKQKITTMKGEQDPKNIEQEKIIVLKTEGRDMKIMTERKKTAIEAEEMI